LNQYSVYWKNHTLVIMYFQSVDQDSDARKTPSETLR